MLCVIPICAIVVVMRPTFLVSSQSWIFPPLEAGSVADGAPAPAALAVWCPIICATVRPPSPAPTPKPARLSSVRREIVLGAGGDFILSFIRLLLLWNLQLTQSDSQYLEMAARQRRPTQQW